MANFFADNTGTHIHVSCFEKYRQTYTLRNLKKQNMIRLWNIWSEKKMPDFIKCYTELPTWYVKVPAWIRSYLPQSFTETYYNDVITHPELSRECFDYQETAVTQLLSRSTWLLHASTGSWKTQMICEITNRLSRKTLIVVQNLTQMTQMVDDIQTILGVIPTQVSWQKYSKKAQAEWCPHITVCSIDSRDKVDPKDYGLILLDEADCYLSSDDRREWVGWLSPEYMYALTGTIKINHVDDSVFKLYYGYKTELKLHHHTPMYRQVYSDFEYYIDDMKQFHEMKEALYSSEDRNKLIVDTVMSSIEGRKCVVFTEYIEHANRLAETFKQKWIKTYVLIGEVSKDERERIRQEAKAYKGEVIIVGSVKILGRGFDLPELSLWVLTTCEKFDSNILQYIGRIIRHYEWKPDPVFIDIVDHMSPMLFNQSNTRMRNYRRAFPDGVISNIQ